jgi:hypothetical protein
VFSSVFVRSEPGALTKNRFCKDKRHAAVAFLAILKGPGLPMLEDGLFICCWVVQVGMAEMSEQFKSVGAEVYLDNASVQNGLN